MPAAAALIVKTLPDGKKGTWTGKVERTRQGAARLPIDDVRYRLKPAKDAAPAVAEVLAKIGKGEATGEYAVTGTVELTDYAWLLVERIAPRNDRARAERPVTLARTPGIHPRKGLLMTGTRSRRPTL